MVLVLLSIHTGPRSAVYQTTFRQIQTPERLQSARKSPLRVLIHSKNGQSHMMYPPSLNAPLGKGVFLAPRLLPHPTRLFLQPGPPHRRPVSRMLFRRNRRCQHTRRLCIMGCRARRLHLPIHWRHRWTTIQMCICQKSISRFLNPSTNGRYCNRRQCRTQCTQRI